MTNNNISLLSVDFFQSKIRTQEKQDCFQSKQIAVLDMHAWPSLLLNFDCQSGLDIKDISSQFGKTTPEVVSLGSSL